MELTSLLLGATSASKTHRVKVPSSLVFVRKFRRTVFLLLNKTDFESSVLLCEKCGCQGSAVLERSSSRATWRGWQRFVQRPAVWAEAVFWWLLLHTIRYWQQMIRMALTPCSPGYLYNLFFSEKTACKLVNKCHLCGVHVTVWWVYVCDFWWTSLPVSLIIWYIISHWTRI